MSEIIIMGGSILYLIFWYLRILAIILSGIMVTVIIIFVVKTNWPEYSFLESLVEFLRSKPYGMKKLQKKWKTISERLKTGNPAEYKMAIIEADEFLEETLAKMKFEGQNNKERLAKVPGVILENTEEVEKAHLIKDNIVQDPDYQIDLEKTKKILSAYEKVLRQLYVP